MVQEPTSGQETEYQTSFQRPKPDQKENVSSAWPVGTHGCHEKVTVGDQNHEPWRYPEMDTQSATKHNALRLNDLTSFQVVFFAWTGVNKGRSELSPGAIEPW